MTLFVEGLLHPWPRNTDLRVRALGRMIMCGLILSACVVFALWMGWTVLLFFPGWVGVFAARACWLNYLAVR